MMTAGVHEEQRATSQEVAGKSAGPLVALLTGGVDRPYAFGLAMALAAKGLRLDFIGSDDLDRPEIRSVPEVRFLNLRGDQRYSAPATTKIRRVLSYYARLLRYGWAAETPVFHILWNNKFETLDRTFLMVYYKVCGRKVALTAHNVNAAVRDAKDSLVNRLTLRSQYRLADHIFVHTEKMKADLLTGFGVPPDRVTVVPFGLNSSVPNTSLTPGEAKRRLGIQDGAKTILFFGRIGPYKGLHLLVEAFRRLAQRDDRYRLIIAGEVAPEHATYFADIEREIEAVTVRDRIIRRIEFIPDEHTEHYFKAADVLVLPYTDVFQSGVLFLGYNFGLPVVAADVGSLKDDIVEYETGLLTRPRDSEHLAEVLATYFDSDIFRHLDARRESIRAYAAARHSWDVVAGMTLRAYDTLEFGSRWRQSSHSRPRSKEHVS
ncbi:MAG: glycosyltransferase family 4 protein [Vicinamibacterales bacterium]